MLIKHSTEKEANKNYVEILYFAKIYTVSEVADALGLLMNKGVVPLAEAISKLLTNEILLPNIDVIEPVLSEYDAIVRVH